MANITRILAIFLIVLAVLLGILAWTISRRPPPPAAPVLQGQTGFAVVVATRDLPAGKPIEADALSLRMEPSRAANQFADGSSLVGRVPLILIAANTPISDTNLSTGLADAIAPGERAVAVRVDEGNAVGNRVRPGNFVDVFFMLKRDMAGAQGADAEVDTTQARLLLSKVRVLSFGDATLPGTSDAAEGAGRLVLALRNPADPEIAEPLAMAPLLVSLRTSKDGAPDGAARAAAGLSLEALSGAQKSRAGRTSAMPPLPSAPPARAPQVRAVSNDLELIRGARREKVAY